MAVPGHPSAWPYSSFRPSVVPHFPPLFLSALPPLLLNMSSIAVSRRALAQTIRQAQPSRRVHSSSVNQATALSSTAGLHLQEQEEIILQPIFDIFDAPTRLAESSQFIREKYRSGSRPAVPQAPEMSVFGAHPSRTLPTSLPDPIIFDGPARPKNAAWAFRSRLRQASIIAPATAAPTRLTRPSSRSFSSSEPYVEMFDGPAKITRYHHQPESQKDVRHFWTGPECGHELTLYSQRNSTAYIAAVGVAAAAGLATLAQNTINA